MTINTDFLVRCINTLESAFEQLQERDPVDPFDDIFRAASVKEFEIVLEQSGSLLKEASATFLLQQQRRGSADLQEHLPACRPT